MAISIYDICACLHVIRQGDLPRNLDVVGEPVALAFLAAATGGHVATVARGGRDGHVAVGSGGAHEADGREDTEHPGEEGSAGVGLGLVCTRAAGLRT